MVRAAAVTALNVLVWWGLLFVLYVVLISSVGPLELTVGAAAALLGAVAAEAVRRAEHPGVRGGRRLAAAAAAFPLTLLAESGRLAAASARASAGHRAPDLVVTIRVGPKVDAALAAVLLSATPGACVLDITPADGAAPQPAQDEGESRAADGARARSGGRAEEPPGTETELTAHLLLGGSPSAVERALGGRRSV